MAFYHKNSSKNSIILGKMGKGRAFYLKKKLFNKYFYEGNLMLGMSEEGIASLKESGNQNVLVVGKTGIGKTSTYSVPNILVEQERSLIVIDPARELYQQTYVEKGNQGYNIETKSLSECDDGVLKVLVQQLVEKKTI
ncbi:type IV secretory system conjugative DNA transfer family protein [Bacillus megaterium NBRC 15308 = ATCC 14581]|nr:type IV secretory system conjugative DNA transfer family protein [Priestia megaterium NBRC 15308 = ATCC 14581]